MKKSRLFLLCFSVVLCGAISSWAATDEPEPIPIRQIGEEIPVFRSPASMPVSCFLVSNTIETYFQPDLGSVSVVLNNLNTGELFSYSVYVGTTSMYFPIFGTVGAWSITFTLPSGIQYYGEFEIE